MVVGAVFIGINLLSDFLYRAGRSRGCGSGDDRRRPCADAWRAWLATTRRGRAAGALGRPVRALRRLLRNPLAAVGLAIIVLLLIVRAFAPLLSASAHSPTRRTLSRAPAAAARRRTGSAPTNSAATSIARIVYGARVTLTIVALVGVIVAPIGLAVGMHGGLFRRRRRRRADAHHRHLPRLPAADAGAGVRRGARARHRERGHRHRADRLAALCAHRPRRDAGHRAQRLHRGRACCRAPRAPRILFAISCRCACPR